MNYLSNSKRSAAAGLLALSLVTASAALMPQSTFADTASDLILKRQMLISVYQQLIDQLNQMIAGMIADNNTATGGNSSTQATSSIAFDNATRYHMSGSYSEHTFNHTVSGNKSVLFLAIETFNSPYMDYVSSVTYGGVPMTRVAYLAPGSQNEWLYVLFNPPTGTNTVDIKLSLGSELAATAASYHGATSTNRTAYGLDDVVTATSHGTSVSATTTPSQTGDWVITMQGNDQTYSSSAGGGITIRGDRQTPVQLPFLGDSNGLVAANQPYGVTWSNNGTIASNAMVIVSLAPATSQ